MGHGAVLYIFGYLGQCHLYHLKRKSEIRLCFTLRFYLSIVEDLSCAPPSKSLDSKSLSRSIVNDPVALSSSAETVEIMYIYTECDSSEMVNIDERLWRGDWDNEFQCNVRSTNSLGPLATKLLKAPTRWQEDMPPAPDNQKPVLHVTLLQGIQHNIARRKIRKIFLGITVHFLSRVSISGIR